MRTIYKYPIDFRQKYVSLPRDAEVLSVGFQGEDLVLWAMVDTERSMGKRKLLVTWTGLELPDDFYELEYDYIGTVTDPHGIVVHVFIGIQEELK